MNRKSHKVSFILAATFSLLVSVSSLPASECNSRIKAPVRNSYAFKSSLQTRCSENPGRNVERRGQRCRQHDYQKSSIFGKLKRLETRWLVPGGASQPNGLKP